MSYWKSDPNGQRDPATGLTPPERRKAVAVVALWLAGRTHLPPRLVTALKSLIPELKTDDGPQNPPDGFS